MLIVLIQPFKKQFGVYNSVHALLILNLGILFSTASCMGGASVQASGVTYSVILSTVVAVLHYIYCTQMDAFTKPISRVFQKMLQ